MTLEIATREDLARLHSEIAEIKAMIAGATITPRADWLTVAQAAKAKEVSKDTIRRWVRHGKIESRGTGKAREVKL